MLSVSFNQFHIAFAATQDQDVQQFDDDISFWTSLDSFAISLVYSTIHSDGHDATLQFPSAYAQVVVSIIMDVSMYIIFFMLFFISH
jgi:hypothetical protein